MKNETLINGKAGMSVYPLFIEFIQALLINLLIVSCVYMARIINSTT